MKTPKVIVAQYGGRHRYAIATMLEEAGALVALYTDSSATSPLGKLSRLCKPIANRSLKRLLQRQPSGIPPQKVFSSDCCVLSDAWAVVVSSNEDWLKRHSRRHEALSERMIRWGVQSADIVYVQSGEVPNFVKYAKEHGKIIVVDVNSHPMHYRMLSEEYSRYPQWGLAIDQPIPERIEAQFKKIAELGDVLLCPSKWVAEGVVSLVPEFSGKIRMCPYGSSIDYSGACNTPCPGRVFYCGSNPVMKGLLDLAGAANILKPRYPHLRFRVAGLLSPRIQRMTECRSLEFLGKLPWRQIREEFLTADMFVLPTRSEGLSSVILEAITAGCPVITTRRAGITIADHGNGIVVSPGDVDGLARGIEMVYRDRGLRNALAANARTLALNYTMRAWRERLVKLLSNMQ